jgi:hypothetical protein
VTTYPRRFMAHDAAAAKRKADRELVRDCIGFLVVIVVVVAVASLQ